ncbi:MAG: sensor histidine kinase, partial [Bacilli bacterium]
MKKLQKKIFIVLSTILTIFLISILILYNYQTYQKEYNSLKNSLTRIENTHNLFFPPIKDNRNEGLSNRPLFIDSKVYVVVFDINYNIKEIINYTDNDEIDETKISNLALNFIKNKAKDKSINRPLSLYLDKYIYSLNNYNLIIIDNSEMNKRLISALDTSVIIFLILELIIIYTSLKLTTWITKPVKETFDKQKQFIYDASHELKTPLSVIIASAEMLEDNPKEKKWLNNIKNESNRMNKLIKDLLSLAKTEDKISEEKYTINNLTKITEMTVLSFESLIYEKGLKIKYNIEKNIDFSCNPEEIKQLIGILLDNAIKHSYDNSKITVNLLKDKENIVLEVINRGDPIPKEEQEKIFERFYRSDKSRNRDENRYGLGLSIAKNIVKNHKGKITVNCSSG